MYTITDLFSHKIHSSDISHWREKLIDLVCIFNEFDGQPYNRRKIVARLQSISPRALTVERDPSKFRDEYSAYPAYLGIYSLTPHAGRWILNMSETAKRFLANEEPDVESFVLLQLILLQYPNGMGVSYSDDHLRLRLQANTSQRMMEMAEAGIKICPIRIIAQALIADSFLQSINLIDASISYKEIFALVNHPRIYSTPAPAQDVVNETLQMIRSGEILPPEEFESRFHILNHTGLFYASQGHVSVIKSELPQYNINNCTKLRLISQMSYFFEEFSTAKSQSDFVRIISSGAWGEYFDACQVMKASDISVLTNSDYVFVMKPDMTISYSSLPEVIDRRTYEFKPRLSGSYDFQPNVLHGNRISVDPELTRIRKQRSNLNHKIILDRLDTYLHERGFRTYENEHIDLYAIEQDEKKWIFEVKSLSEGNLLNQTRKALSQLYEYRFRYKEITGVDVKLCIVLPGEPQGIEWLQEYLCTDRNISVIWMPSDHQVCFSPQCAGAIISIVN
jgi:hypothetical protein